VELLNATKAQRLKVFVILDPLKPGLCIRKSRLNIYKEEVPGGASFFYLLHILMTVIARACLV
jgi:hypothetical protein